jgi:hypothetical protein
VFSPGDRRDDRPARGARFVSNRPAHLAWGLPRHGSLGRSSTTPLQRSSSWAPRLSYFTVQRDAALNLNKPAWSGVGWHPGCSPAPALRFHLGQPVARSISNYHLGLSPCAGVELPLPTHDFAGLAGSAAQLQAGVSAARAWCDKWRMQANMGPGKGAVMLFALEAAAQPLVDGHLGRGGAPLPTVVQVPGGGAGC